MQILLFCLLTSGLLTLQTTHCQGQTANMNTDDDFVKEAVADDFIVDAKATPSVKKIEKREITSPKNIYSEVNPSLPPTEDSSHPIINPEEGLLNSSGTVVRFTPSQSTTLSKNIIEGSGDLTDFRDFSKITEVSTSVMSTTRDMEALAEEVSELHEERTVVSPLNATDPTPTEDFFSSSLVYLPSAELDGSGMEPESSTPSGVPESPIVPEKELIKYAINENTVNSIPAAEPTTKVPMRRRLNIPTVSPDRGPESTISAKVEKGTPDWLVIFAFCLTLGAFLLIIAGIATKDKWFGPKKQHVNVSISEPSKEYANRTTLPLSEKEQQLVTLMGSVDDEKKDKDFSVINLNDVPEKEYLM